MGVGPRISTATASAICFVTHLDQETNTFYRGLADGRGYVDATTTSGLGQPSWHLTAFGVAALDIELDGDLDLAIGNGRVTLAAAAAQTSLPPPWSLLAEPNLFFVNGGDGIFHSGDPRVAVFVERVEISRGLLATDIDLDGDLDVVLANAQGSPRIYRNEAPRLGDWLAVHAVDPRLGRDAIGARVALERAGRLEWRTLRRSTSYASSRPAVAHFTLPPATTYDSLRIVWPDGLEERFGGGAGNRRLTLQRGTGEAI